MFVPVRFRSARSLLRHAAGATALTLLLTVAVPVAGAQDQPNAATIQWAQQILDQQGFYQGRASGRMDSATAAAIANYQRKNGLKATGRLDQTTIDRMLESRPERQGVGNLADPNSRARASQPLNLREEDVRPQAAPVTAGVERGGGTESTLLGVSRGAAETSPPRTAAPPAASTPAPASGVDRGDVGTTIAGRFDGPTAAPASGVETEVMMDRQEGEDGFSLSAAPDWVRYGLIGGVGALLIGMLGFWWGSGRRATKPAPRAAAPKGRPQGTGAPRREPTLGGDPARQDGRRDPVLTAPSRDPHRTR
ncbi:peptidoglycan-binding domain-containing protein [Niveispirillum fermenti]|uniref:peptidoglycan-binding domain-containing protein n=1 Tax=Niveispirillum fermenti TaxID=1233113 RepID=UPI003A898897